MEPDETEPSTLAQALGAMFDPWMAEYENPAAESYCSVCGKITLKASLDASLRCDECQP